MPTDGSSLDLRGYLSHARSGEQNAYLEVTQEISPRWQTAAIVAKLARKMRNPVVYFSSVSGTALPVVTNVCCSFERVARSAGLDAGIVSVRMARALEEPVPAVERSAGESPVLAKRFGPGQFSLRDLPQFFYTDTQTAPYLTAAILVARDPLSGAHNLSFHRLMICGDHEVAIYMTPGGHLEKIWHRNREQGRATPVAAVFGFHPLWAYGSLAAGPLDVDDYGVIGAVLGEGLAVTRGVRHSELRIPALAEMVYEGQIEAEVTEPEGPFGEFLGYVAPREVRPVLRFTHLCSREQPIFQDIVAGQSEHVTMSSVTLRARLTRNYFRSNDAVVDFWLPAAMTLFLAVDSGRQTDFDAQQTMRRLLHEERYLKQVVCFDANVDLRKQASVQAALATNVQADRDLELLPDCPGNGVDPSEVDGRTCKLAIDARSKGSVVTSRLPQEIEDSVHLEDWLE
ncbi:MAG: UbiD family decarboxylase domain-containing protein [Woeseiaceae bacterium]